MPFSFTAADRERDKFVETPGGNTAVRVMPADGSTSPGALEGAGISGIVSTSTTAQALVATAGPLANRKGIYIMATNANNFLGFSASMVAAQGLLLPNNQILYIEAKSTASIYVRRTSGTGSVTVWEVL
jgi:hypothetical protein